MLILPAVSPRIDRNKGIYLWLRHSTTYAMTKPQKYDEAKFHDTWLSIYGMEAQRINIRHIYSHFLIFLSIL